MKDQLFETSSIRQGMSCPLNGCPGVLDLWKYQNARGFYLVCDECDANWRIEEGDVVDQAFFDTHIETASRRDTDRENLVRILDHRLFSTDPKDFSNLIQEAWRRRANMVGLDSTQYEVVVLMDRAIGKKGENWISLKYNALTDRIVGAKPICY